MKFKYFLLLLFVIMSNNHLFAQLQTGETLDKIVAVVGNEIILQSDIDGRVVMMAQNDRSIKLNDQVLKDKILNQLIDEKLLVAKAIEDSIEVSDNDIKMRWEHFLQTSIQSYGSRARLEQVYGMSISKIEQEVRQEIRNQLLSTKLTESKFANVQVSRAEVEEFYRKNKDSLPEIPLSVDLYHIVKKVKPDEDLRKDIFNRAKAIRDSILRGADFADMASKYSADAVTAKDGGDLGWFDRGRLIPEFERAAFGLQIDEISMPVETPYGFHIIQTLGKRENSINTRHILFRIEQGDDAMQSAQDFLSDLKRQVLEEGKQFEELAKLHSDDQDTKGFGGALGTLPLDNLPEGIDAILSSLKDGDISDPLKYGTNQLEPAFHIIYRKRTIEKHIPNLEDNYDMILQYATQDKKYSQFQEWIAKLREDMYWEIRK